VTLFDLGLTTLYSPSDSAKWCASFVELSPRTHICAHMQWGQYLCSVCRLAFRTLGKWSRFGENMAVARKWWVPLGGIHQTRCRCLKSRYFCIHCCL